jgi:hypothetical protein
MNALNWAYSVPESKSMVHVGIEVIVQKYLGNCQTFWYLFHFGKMRLSISKTKIFSDRLQ